MVTLPGEVEIACKCVIVQIRDILRKAWQMATEF